MASAIQLWRRTSSARSVFEGIPDARRAQARTPTLSSIRFPSKLLPEPRRRYQRDVNSYQERRGRASVCCVKSSLGGKQDDTPTTPQQPPSILETPHIPEEGSASPSSEQPVSPTPRDAINWFCISLILLISLTDFTPLGAALQSAPSTASPSATPSSSAPWILALVQWLFFVAPTVSWAKDCRFPLSDTFKLKPCSVQDLGMGALGGIACWGLVGALLSLKNGSLPESAAYLADSTLGSSPGSLADLLWFAASPAAAEEILFRGFVLSALMTRFGSIDSVMLAAAMFGAFHLSVSQLFPTMVLGIAAGFVTLATGSVFPAMALHFTNNAAAVLLGGVGPLGS